MKPLAWIEKGHFPISSAMVHKLSLGKGNQEASLSNLVC